MITPMVAPALARTVFTDSTGRVVYSNAEWVFLSFSLAAVALGSRRLGSSSLYLRPDSEAYQASKALCQWLWILRFGCGEFQLEPCALKFACRAANLTTSTQRILAVSR